MDKVTQLAKPLIERGEILFWVARQCYHYGRTVIFMMFIIALFAMLGTYKVGGVQGLWWTLTALLSIATVLFGIAMSFPIIPPPFMFARIMINEAFPIIEDFENANGGVSIVDYVKGTASPPTSQLMLDQQPPMPQPTPQPTPQQPMPQPTPQPTPQQPMPQPTPQQPMPQQMLEQQQMPQQMLEQQQMPPPTPQQQMPQPTQLVDLSNQSSPSQWAPVGVATGY